MPDLFPTKLRKAEALVFLSLAVWLPGCVGSSALNTTGANRPPAQISSARGAVRSAPAISAEARQLGNTGASSRPGSSSPVPVASRYRGSHPNGFGRSTGIPHPKVNGPLPQGPHPGLLRVPTERRKRVLPPYVIAPPDVLQLSSANLIPKPNRPIRPLDVISVEFPIRPLKEPTEQEDLFRAKLNIAANFTVELDGTIRLGDPYNVSVPVAGLPAKQASLVVAKALKGPMKKPRLVDEGGVEVKLVQAGGLQAIQGAHLVRTDGTIGLGTYGSVFITGLTVAQAKAKIEQHLSEFLQEPIISIEVVGFNSQVYYVIFDGGGLGEQLIRLPVTGNETVLDAIGQVNGLPAVASRSHVWVARPGLTGEDGAILPVNWRDITQRGITKTNYQMLPGDRLYVKADPLVTLNTYFDRFLAPVERVFGAILLGNSTVRSLQFSGQGAGVGFIGGF